MDGKRNVVEMNDVIGRRVTGAFRHSAANMEEEERSSTTAHTADFMDVVSAIEAMNMTIDETIPGAAIIAVAEGWCEVRGELRAEGSDVAFYEYGFRATRAPGGIQLSFHSAGEGWTIPILMSLPEPAGGSVNPATDVVDTSRMN